MHALRGLWKASPLLKRTVYVAGGLCVGLQIHNAIYPERNIAHAFWNTSPKTPPPPAPPPQSIKQRTLTVGPYGPTSFSYSDEEMKKITYAAIRLYREGIASSNSGVEDFMRAIWPTWGNACSKAMKANNQKKLSEQEINEWVQDSVKQFNAALTNEGRAMLGAILQIIGVQNVDQIFSESMKIVLSDNPLTNSQALPFSLRVCSRLRELRQWNEAIATDYDFPDIRGTKIGEVPALFQQKLFTALKEDHPNLDNEVAKLMGEIGNLRVKVGLLQPYIKKEWDFSQIDQKFALLNATSEWATDYITLSSSKDKVLAFDDYAAERAKKEMPTLSQQDKQTLTEMAKDFLPYVKIAKELEEMRQIK